MSSWKRGVCKFYETRVSHYLLHRTDRREIAQTSFLKSFNNLSNSAPENTLWRCWSQRSASWTRSITLQSPRDTAQCTKALSSRSSLSATLSCSDAMAAIVEFQDYQLNIIPIVTKHTYRKWYQCLPEIRPWYFFSAKKSANWPRILVLTVAMTNHSSTAFRATWK